MTKEEKARVEKVREKREAAEKAGDAIWMRTPLDDYAPRSRVTLGPKRRQGGKIK